MASGLSEHVWTIRELNGRAGKCYVEAKGGMGVAFIILLLLSPIILVFITVVVAVYWPSRFSLRGLLVFMTWIAIALGLAATMYHWQK